MSSLNIPVSCTSTRISMGTAGLLFNPQKRICGYSITSSAVIVNVTVKRLWEVSLYASTLHDFP
jgi:hypothetical protein